MFLTTLNPGLYRFLVFPEPHIQLIRIVNLIMHEFHPKNMAIGQNRVLSNTNCLLQLKYRYISVCMTLT
jgi:hypothetical protein